MGVRGRDDEGHFLGYQSCRNCGQDTDEWDEPDPTEYCKICNSECTPDPDCEPYTLDGNGPFCGEHWVEQGIAEHNAWKERGRTGARGRIPHTGDCGGRCHERPR